MPRVYLQEMVDEIRFDALPVTWNAFDIGVFSRMKRLWDYQQKAVENAIKAMWKYYEDFHDYQANERDEANRERKQKFFQWYRDNGLDEELDIPLAGNHRLTGLLGGYYAIEDEKISYDQFINRACFWMATGSGKTLVLLKLIEVLRGLIQRGEIPPHDILILSCRDDLIEQLKKHVHEFNTARSDLFIHLLELREYADAKRHNPFLFKEHELTVFFYRSDNLSDEQQERIIDFRNYDDGGKWYVLLDEAHKGDREESKRQHIYSILSRNGFLFNFSATFTEARDLTTTVSNFNLSEFIRAGYGKHIAILQQELRAFRDDQDYNNEEKQKIVLQSLLMLAYARKFSEKVRRAKGGLYHKPMLLTLVNSVNTEDADLKLFFKELERIGKGEVSEQVWKVAKEELWEELRQQPALMFEDGERLKIDEEAFEKLERKEIDLDGYTAGVERAARMVREAQAEYSGKRLKIRHVANHYYVPMILSGETERIEYIKHIVQTPSEIDFLNRLEEYLAKPGNRFKDFDWWMFSKLDESLDKVYIPYYDGTSNKVREFKPDFIVWLQKGNEYFIVFVDPKGTEHTDYQRKIDGYSATFEEAGNTKKRLRHKGKKVIVFAFLHTADEDGLPKEYKRYWFDNVGKVLTSILAPG